MHKVANAFKFEFWTNMLSWFVSIHLFQLLDHQGCATMRLSFSASQTEAVFHLPGSVMVTQTVKMAVMNTTPAHLAPALPHSSVVITETVCYRAGFVMGTMTAGT